MRYIYKDIKNPDSVSWEWSESPDGKSNSQDKIATSDAQALVDSGEAVLYDTIADLNIAVRWKKSRRDDYPDIRDQLDQIYHEGIDAWKETIKAVKDAHSKPTGSL